MAEGPPDHPPLDRRLVPARPDLAARHLDGEVEAECFVDPTEMEVTAPIAALALDPSPCAALDTELLHGERFDVYEIANGMAWGQAQRDGYVGYVPHGCLGTPTGEPTHRVTALVAQIYPQSDMKTRPIGWLTLGARLAIAETGDRFATLIGGGHMALQHIAPLDHAAPDWVATAERLLGTPYLWGGRSTIGCDCSSLIQLARQASDLDCPRDTDMQEAGLGETLEPGTTPERGDLVFWKRHVGIMLDDRRMLHANAHAMATTVEDLDAAIRRIEAQGGGPVTRHARLDTRAPAP